MVDSIQNKKKAVLVALIGPYESDIQSAEYLEELALLAETAGIVTVKKYTQKLKSANPATFIGKGKLEEIIQYIRNNDIDVIIFDDDLSPSQLRNLERATECQVYDRSLLILDIFLLRAKTAQARTQVELARYQYLLPRLTKLWTHLERQRGGTGTRGGAGEKEIETDRRAIRNQITILDKKLEKIVKQNDTRRKSRKGITRVALVGYTNAGKSTLMSLLAKTDTYIENKLFATVDSLVRKAVINDIPFLVSDTVGFIRKLPHHLIEAFKSTLDEVRESDILLHVIDISHPAHEEQISVVNDTLKDIGAADKPTLLIYNKTDLLIRDRLEQDPLLNHGELETYYYSQNNNNGIYLSAYHKKNIDGLRSKLFELVKSRHIQIYPNYLKSEIY
jgi:GTP-binding protein HflX